MPLALPRGSRSSNLKTLQAGIEKLRVARCGQARPLKPFSSLCSLIEPQAPTVEEIRKVLDRDEVFLSFYRALL
jgi:hypothetical protein